MMSNTPIGMRRFTHGKNSKHHVDVFIYPPTEEQKDFRCRYEIREAGRLLREGHALGVDSLQALILALQKLGADVTFSDYGVEKSLYWNDQNIDLGLLLPRET